MKRWALFGMSLAGVLAVAAGAADTPDDPLTRPIAAESAARWLKPQAPARIFGKTWLVGFAGLNVGLIETSAGLILVDGAVPQGVRAVEANIRKAGFRVEDVKLILSTEPHFDHAGGLAALARDTGATVVASIPAAAVLRRGKSGADDPQAAWLTAYPPVQAIRTVRDGEPVRLGDTVVIAHATPGHTPGSMSWSWRSCEGRTCANIVFASSLNPLAAENYRFSDPAHPQVVAGFRRTFATMRTMPCDILITPHPEQSGGDVKYTRLQEKRVPNPFVDKRACADYADAYEQLFDAQLAKEGGK